MRYSVKISVMLLDYIHYSIAIAMVLVQYLFVCFFQKPAKLQLKPDYGPIAGGTSISITGELLGDQSVSVILYLVDVLELEKYDMSRLVTKPTK